MRFTEGNLYHIYNRGNNKQPVYFTPANYIYFLKQVRHFLLPHCDMLCYCLMPNHFHFLVFIKPTGDIRYRQTDVKETTKSGQTITISTERHPLAAAIGYLLSSYTQSINKQNNTSGSVFQQKTKAKGINQFLYGETCFHYIHQNPLKAGMVTKMEDWSYSSFTDYAGFRNGTLCNQQLACELLNLNKETFYEDSYKVIMDEAVNNIF